MSDQITPEEAPSEIKGYGTCFLLDKLVDKPEGEILKQAEKGDAKHQYLLALEYWLNDLHLATKWCRKSADQEYAPAQCFLGFLYGNEYLTFPGYDLAESAKWHRKAADQGHAPAQFFLGVMYDKGEGVAQNHAEAARWYRKAAEQGIHEAQFNLGLKYDKGQGLPQDHTEAVRWFRKAAEQDLNNNVLRQLGLTEAQFTLGLKYESGQGLARDYIHAHMWMTVAASMAGSDGRKSYSAARDRVAAKMNPTQIAEAQRLAASWYRKAAEWGEAFAQFHLGVIYSNGRGVPQNYAEAIRWYQKAAESGNTEAQFNLGCAFDAGQGVRRDRTEAMKWYREAANKGHADAQLNLAAGCRYGLGIPQNHAEAIRWFRKAAEQGNARAQTMLGHAYTDGEVVRQDYGEAAQWFRKAAEQGFAYAQGHLGLAYQNGLGVPMDYVQAHLWTSLAARSYPASDDKNRNIEVSNLDLLSRKMTPSQIAEARRLTQEWKPLEERRSKSERMDLPEESTRQMELTTGVSAPITTSASGLSQVVGMANLKEQLIHDVIGPSKNPELYRRYRVSLPNGILFFGPPGCGKTYIARSLAAELGWSFQYCRPSDVASPYIHETVSKIHSVFATAIEKAPSIVFIDEFEAFVPARSGLGGHQQYKAEEVNEFLANLEGCAERKVLVIAATNEPDKIDPAVRRSGRFDKLILIPPPDAEARQAMLEYHLNDRPTEASLDTAGIAAVLEGYSASDIKLLVEEASRMALKTQGLIATSTLLAVLERVPASITADDMQRYELFRSRGIA